MRKFSQPVARSWRMQASDHRVAGATFAPGLQAFLVDVVFVKAVARAQTVGCARHIAPLDGRLVFEFLHEMAVPAQAAGEAAQTVGQAAIGRGSNARFGGLVHAAHRDRTEGKVRAQPAAAIGGGEWAGHCAAVVAPAAVEKTVERSPRGALAA